MILSRSFLVKFGGMTLLALAICGMPRARVAFAQAAADKMSTGMMAYPTGDKATSNLLLEVSNPSQVVVGRAYDYMIKVTNLTKSMTLENVKVSQTVGEGFGVETSEPAADKSAKGMASWVIPRLDPGKVVTIKASGLGEKTGNIASCLKVSYDSSLCMSTEFTKPEIAVTKEAPKMVALCDPITLKYVVKNTGTGPVRGLKMSDELPKGLTTADGKQTVAADVGDLAQGQSKDVTVNVVASQPGDYTSRAMAMGDQDLKAQSNQTTTAIRESKLAVDIVGPETEYMDQRVTYQITVKNDGEATAKQASLKVSADPNAKVLRVSKVGPEAPAPTMEGNMMSWNLGDLAPGKSVVVSMTTSSDHEAPLKHVATATSVCARGGDVAKAAQDTIVTQMITLPALLLELVDQKDPMQVGTEEVYTIVVLNQGKGEDGNVKIVCHLPEGFEYVSSTGPTTGKADGLTVTFDPIEKFAPKRKVTYTINAKVVKAGDVRTKVDLSSDYLTTPVTETEPTRLIQ